MNRKLRLKIVEVFGSQSDFAQAIREDETIISRVIRGRRSLPVEKQEAWAKTLKCKPEEIFMER